MGNTQSEVKTTKKFSKQRGSYQDYQEWWEPQVHITKLQEDIQVHHPLQTMITVISQAG